jgi:hypothetical protein
VSVTLHVNLRFLFEEVSKCNYDRKLIKCESEDLCSFKWSQTSSPFNQLFIVDSGLLHALYLKKKIRKEKKRIHPYLSTSMNVSPLALCWLWIFEMQHKVFCLFSIWSSWNILQFLLSLEWWSYSKQHIVQYCDTSYYNAHSSLQKPCKLPHTYHASN